jgi:hypothetical protein
MAERLGGPMGKTAIFILTAVRNSNPTKKCFTVAITQQWQNNNNNNNNNTKLLNLIL